MLADQLTLYQSGGSDYDHHIATRPTGFSELPTALQIRILQIFGGQIQCYSRLNKVLYLRKQKLFLGTKKPLEIK